MPREVTINFAPKEGIRIPFTKVFFADVATDEDMRLFGARLVSYISPAAKISMSRRVCSNPTPLTSPGEGCRLTLVFVCEDNSTIHFKIEHFDTNSSGHNVAEALLGKICSEKGSPAIKCVRIQQDQVNYV